MSKFKTPNVIYLQVSNYPERVTWCRDQIENSDVKYVRIDKHWKKKFKKLHPTLCLKEAGVIKFIERMVGDETIKI